MNRTGTTTANHDDLLTLISTIRNFLKIGASDSTRWLSSLREIMSTVMSLSPRDAKDRSSLNLPLDSPLHIVDDRSEEFRRTTWRASIRAYRTILACRVVSYSNDGDSVVGGTVIEDYCDFQIRDCYDGDFDTSSSSNNNSSSNSSSSNNSSITISVVTREIEISIRTLVSWLIGRVVPIRTVLRNIESLKVERVKLRDAHERELELARVNDMVCVVPGVPPEDCFSWRSRARDAIERRIDSLETRVNELSVSLANAPAEAQIRVAEVLAALRAEFETLEREQLDDARAREMVARAESKTLREATVRIELMLAIVTRMRVIASNVRTVFSSEMRALVMREHDLRVYNDSLETENNGDGRRIVQIVRREAARTSGSAVLEPSETEHITSRVFPRVAMSPDEVAVALTAMCSRQCDRLLDIAVASPLRTMEARANRTRDRLVAFLYRHGNNAELLSYVKHVLFDNRQQWRYYGIEISSAKNREQRLFRELMDWPAMRHVPSSVLSIIVNLFQWRLDRFTSRTHNI